MTQPHPETTAGLDLAGGSGNSERPSGQPRRSRPGRLVGAVLLLVSLAATVLAVWRYPHEVEVLWRSIRGVAGKPAPAKADTSSGVPETLASRAPWDGAVTLTPQARAALGVETEAARPQAEPLRLELLGTTEYISDTLTKVRPMFKGRVDKVHVTVGRPVQKGEPLIDLFSTELAQAKSAYEIERIQWLYDKRLLEIRESLLASKTVSQQLYDETRNNEMKERREFEVARDKLLVYGLTEAEIERVEHESGSEKARLTLRSTTDGIVIERDVAVGNLYDENDTLLVIAPLDRLWVWGNVFERDLDLVELGQSWEIHFPFLRQTFRGKVDYISNRVDPSSHAVRVRTSIPNEGGRLKSDMLVRGIIEVPPVAGRVVVPRSAMIVGDREAHVFVEDDQVAGRFRRRPVSVAHETESQVVIGDGLRAGEKVVTIGGLILAQVYEDLRVAETGALRTD
ncbi:MAG: efflux RND transporter periplasmic adaptor subunit [Isosphaeraceae bacterium]